MAARITIIGIGHPDRGDDAIGRIVAARLAPRAGDGVDVIGLDGEATALLERLGETEHAIVVDAVLSGAPPGTIRRFDVVRQALPTGTGLSSHGFGLAEAVELARALGRLPARCTVFAVEAASFDHGAPLSCEVAAAADEVVGHVLAEINGSGPCMSTA
jgi:hydrogenase maturation protease